MNLGKRKAIYMYFPQGIPACMTIDADKCIYHKRVRAGKKPACRNCEKECQAGAVDFEQKDEEIVIQANAIVVSTGLSQYDAGKLPQYGFGKIKNVVTGMEMERLLSASGPTGGHVEKLSDHKPVKKIAFLQCVGSRNIGHSAFCSSVCCMHSTKEAILANDHDREVKSYILYTDFRAVGKGFQEYMHRAQNEYGVEYIRARASDIQEDADGSPVVNYEDITTGEKGQLKVDLVVLAMSLIPSESTVHVADALGLELDKNGFIKTDPLYPVRTTREGIFACGYCQGPLDIPESVAQASGAAAEAAQHLAARKLQKA
jgi:heterodisulfide reductase subunit A